MTTKSMSTFIEGNYIGRLSEDKSGKHTFQYDASAKSQLSLSMPKRSIPWTGKAVEAYIDGILPDVRGVRERIGRLYDVNANNPFSLLTAVGLDCPGGVQFVPEGQEELLNRTEEIKSISEEEIGKRLSSLSGHAPRWQTADEHWSLAGAQSKISLRFQHETWYKATGAAATTHILKPGVDSLQEQAFDEYICMKTLENLKLPTASTRFQTFAGVSSLVSTRWDRAIKTDSTGTHIMRIHQEDFCQAMGYMTQNKYQSAHGPSAVEMIDFMHKQQFSYDDMLRFTAALIINFLIGGTDAHAKNYAIVETTGKRPRLAPLYDVASIFAYDNPSDLKNEHKLAMSIGREYRYDRIETRHWIKFAQDCNLKQDDVLQLLALYSTLLPDTFETSANDALQESATFSTPEETKNREHMIAKIQAGIVRQCNSLQNQ